MMKITESHCRMACHLARGVNACLAKIVKSRWTMVTYGYTVVHTNRHTDNLQVITLNKVPCVSEFMRM